MKRNILLSLLFVLVLVGCSSPHNDMTKYADSTKTENSSEDVNDSSNNELTIWSSENNFEYVIEEFNRKYPDVKVEVVIKEPNKLVDEYMDSIINKETPDIYMIPESELGTFSGISGLENLNSQPYNSTDIIDKLPEELLQNYLSVQDNKLYAVPVYLFPMVTYYRADILEEAGFPTDPVWLASYLENPDNWLAIAKELKKQDKYILEYKHSLFFYLNGSTNYFDENWSYIRNNELYQNTMYASKSVVDNNLALEDNVWSESGQQAIRDGKLVMFYLPSYGLDHLKEWAPNQNGKWRVTRMPLGSYGTDKVSGKTLAISSYSDQKTMAWEFIKITLNNLKNSIESNNHDNFFGGQNVNKVFREIITEDVPGIPTPFDTYADEIWNLSIYDMQVGDYLEEDLLFEIEKNLEERTRLDKQALLKYLDK